MLDLKYSEKYVTLAVMNEKENFISDVLRRG